MLQNVVLFIPIFKAVAIGMHTKLKTLKKLFLYCNICLHAYNKIIICVAYAEKKKRGSQKCLKKVNSYNAILLKIIFV